MECKKCGVEVKDGTKFCGVCGADLLEKKKSKLPKVLLIVALIIVVLGGAAFIFRDALASMFTFLMPAEKQLQAAYQKSAETWSKETGTFVGDLKKNLKVQTLEGKSEGNLALEVNSELLEELLGVDLGDVNQANLAYEIVQNEDGVGIDLVLGLEETDVVSGKLVIDMKEELMTVQVPELNEQAIQAPIELNEMSASVEEAEAMMESMNQMIPEKEFAEQFIPRYIKAALLAIDEVEREKGTLEAGDVSQDATSLTVILDEEMVEKIGEAVLAEIKEDEGLEDYLKNVYEAAMKLDGEEPDEWKEVYSELLDTIEEGIKELEDADAVQDGLEFVTWVNSKNEVIGVEFGGYASWLSVEDEEKVAEEIVIAEDGEELCKVLIEGEESENVFSGKVKLYVEGESTLTLNVDKYEKKENGMSFTGSVKLTGDMIEAITGESWLLGDLKVKMSMDVSGNSSELKVDISVNDEKQISVEVSGKYKEGKTEIEQPENIAEDLSTWTFDFTEILDNMKEAGLPEDFVDQLATLVTYYMYY